MALTVDGPAGRRVARGGALRRGAARPPQSGREELSAALAASRSAFVMIGLFSFVINLLMLAPPLYMLQVYNRVLGTGRVETLIALTVMVGVALLVLGALEALRSVVGARVGRWLEQALAPAFLRHGIARGAKGEHVGAQSLRDLASVRSFASSPSLGVFFAARK